jgi:hypothetical protein
LCPAEGRCSRVATSRLGRGAVARIHDADPAEAVALDAADTFFDDAPFGTMTLRFLNGDVYKGAFPAGPGSLTYANGDVLEGQFIEGVANGPCRLFRAGGGGGVGDWQGGEQLPPGARYGQFPTVAAAWEAYRKGYPE